MTLTGDTDMSNASNPPDDVAQPATSPLKGGISFRNYTLAAPEYGDKKERRAEAKRSEVLAHLLTEPESAEGEVVLSKAFARYGDIAKLDMLSDWIGLLQREYDRIHKEVYHVV
jgi:hypothetical protein